MAELLFNIMYIISIRAFNNTIADFTILPHVEYGKKKKKFFSSTFDCFYTIYKGFLIRNENAALKLLELST